METDELKTVWAKYDKKLTENLKLNVELLRKMNLDKSKREMNTIINSEIFGIIMGGFGILFFLSATIRFSGEFKFFISGLLTSIAWLFFIILSIKKVMYLSNIDYYNSSIVTLQKSIMTFKQKFFIYKKIEIAGGLFFAVVLPPILVKALRNIDLYADPWRHIIGVTIGLAIGYPIAFWIYKNWYEKKMQNTEQFLKEIEKFEVES